MMSYIVVSSSNGNVVLQVTCVVCEQPKQLTITTAELQS
jgi:hypothetical protein